MPTKKSIRLTAKCHGVNSLLSVDKDPKTAKSNRAGKGYLTAIQYLAPAKLSGNEVCSSRSAGCTIACLHTAGNKAYLPAKTRARVARTKLYFKDRELYADLLNVEIQTFVDKCNKLSMRPAIRLNGTSDILWEKVLPEIFDRWSNVQFYDYTKHVKRCAKVYNGKPVRIPPNYHLTFSRSEENAVATEFVLQAGCNRVAVVFDRLPTTWKGYRVGNCDKDDLRFLDRGFRVCGLIAKGDARKDTSGFVIRRETNGRARLQANC